MQRRIDEAYDTLEAAQKRANQLRVVDPITEAYISGPHKMDEELAMSIYGKRDIWTVSGNIYRG
jgi:hypothetical protein